jgi:hypothetical protein
VERFWECNSEKVWEGRQSWADYTNASAAMGEVAEQVLVVKRLQPPMMGKVSNIEMHKDNEA